MAVAILGLGITSVLQLMGTAARNAARAQATTTAAFVAEELMEELLALDEAGLLDRQRESGTYAEREHGRAPARVRAASSGRDGGGAQPAPRLLYAVSVAREPRDAGLYRVDLEVTWRDPAPGRLALTTYRQFAIEDLDLEPEP